MKSFLKTLKIVTAGLIVATLVCAISVMLALPAGVTGLAVLAGGLVVLSVSSQD